MIVGAIVGVVFGGLFLAPMAGVALVIWAWQAIARRALNPAPKERPMTDTTTTPIIVNADPAPDQWTVLARQLVLVLGPLASFAALNHMTGLNNDLNMAIAIIGPLASLASLVMGQIHTRHAAQKLATMANALPNTVAQTK